MEKKTVRVSIWGGRHAAYAERATDTAGKENYIVRVLDDVAGYYTTCHSLTQGQERYVIGRTAGSAH